MRRHGSSTPPFWCLAAAAVSYRLPLKVTQVKVFKSTACGTTGYYVCPRCRSTIEREHMAYCSCCGQRLDWSDCKNAQVVYPERQGPSAPYT